VDRSNINSGLTRKCSKLVNRRKQAKLQWLQDSGEVNECNLSDVRRENSGGFKSKKLEHLKNKINELESNGKNKNIAEMYKGIKEFKKCYQPRTKWVRNERGDLLADPHETLNTLKNDFCQLLNVHGAGGVRQTEMHTAKPFVPEHSAS
jgi:succinate dehydrogenase/fumarate reductase flavoprotein subunit